MAMSKKAHHRKACGPTRDQIPKPNVALTKSLKTSLVSTVSVPSVCTTYSGAPQEWDFRSVCSVYARYMPQLVTNHF